MGIVAQRTGSVRLEGRELIALTSDKIAKAGIAFCPEERGIFASLDVQENLFLPPELKPGGLSADQVFELFPNIKERLKSQGTKLSGGEQQMLAIGRILRTGARLLLLDEPTEGLAPVIIQQIGKTIRTLKAQGFTILLVEQNFRFASTVADRYYVMEHGRIIDRFTPTECRPFLGKPVSSMIDTSIGPCCVMAGTTNSLTLARTFSSVTPPDFSTAIFFRSWAERPIRVVMVPAEGLGAPRVRAR